MQLQFTDGHIRKTSANIGNRCTTTISPDFLELVSITDEQLELANKYVQEGALASKFHSDAQHIAIASILKVDSLVSWNFKHIVNFFRIRQFNQLKIWLFNH